MKRVISLMLCGVMMLSGCSLLVNAPVKTETHLALETLEPLPSYLQADETPALSETATDAMPTPTPDPSNSSLPKTASEYFKTCKWITKDADVSDAGVLNMLNANTLFTKYKPSDIKKIKATSISLTKIDQALYKYVGKMASFTCEISDITAYAPGSDESNNLADGKECGELTVFDPKTYTGYAHILVVGPGCDKFDEGNKVTITALIIGYLSGNNAFGGEVSNIVAYSCIEFVSKTKK